MWRRGVPLCSRSSALARPGGFFLSARPTRVWNSSVVLNSGVPLATNTDNLPANVKVHDETTKLRQIRRPLSPHIAIYKLPFHAMNSFANRVAGVVLFAGVTGVAFTSLFGAHDMVHYIDAYTNAMPGIVVWFTKLEVALPFVYHYVSGLRHLFWDRTAKGLGLKSVNLSSGLVLAVTAAVALGLSVYEVQ